MTSTESFAKDILDIAGGWEEKEKQRKEVYLKPEFQKLLEEHQETWKKLLIESCPNLGAETFKLNIEETIRGLTYIDYFSRNCLKTADAIFLQPRDQSSDDPLLQRGVEDLIENFTSGNLDQVLSQITDAVNIIDGSSFSAKHNIHLGLIPLYIIRDEAYGLQSHLGYLIRNI